MSATAKRYKFKAEVTQVLNLVVNSLYSNKEIFLRELISNASDAIDKLQFRAIQDKALLGDDEPSIRIVSDPEKKTLAIEDDGIGMSREELVKDLGTIAHSGTQAFLEQVQSGNDDVNLIGKFGVGFYSAFLVAERVDVTSRAAGSNEAFTWRSTAEGGFAVAPAERATPGTTVLLHLKEEQTDFGLAWRLRHLVRKYSDFVNHPIRMRADSEEHEWETVNSASALWTRKKDEITQQQYDDFYEHLTGDFQGVLANTHFEIEGMQRFTGLLYIPQKAPFDLSHQSGRRGVRLYVKRVFIMEDCEELLPTWLRFVRGVIDSDDLPLNVSRELLQDSRLVQVIRKQIVKKTLDLLESVASQREAAYEELWAAFGSVIKEGLHLEHKLAERLSKLLRYRSTAGDELTSLEAYVERMPQGQSVIYYIAGESLEAVSGSPHLEALRKRGYEVLFMTDPVDEWAVQGIPEFDSKKLVSASHADLDLDESEEEKAKHAEAAEGLAPLVEVVQELLQDRVKEVRISNRLTDSPVCLVVPPGGLGAHLEKLLKAHDQAVPETKRILELNADHVVIERLDALRAVQGAGGDLAEWVEVLYGQALIGEGSPLPKPHEFTARLTRLLEKAASQG